MKNTARKTGPTEPTRPQLREVLAEVARDQANVQLVLGLRHLVRENLREFVISAGAAALAAVLEEEPPPSFRNELAHLRDRRDLVLGDRPLVHDRACQPAGRDRVPAP